jgi:group I intron endonuclease
MKREIICGVYAIKNLITGQHYVGCAVDINRRWCEHKSDLKNNKHDNDYLQRSWNKYTKNNFEFFVVQECEENCIFEYERYYIKMYQSRADKMGFNLNDGGRDGPARPTEETRKKMSESGKERFTEEVRKEWSERFSGEGNPRYGAIMSEETKNKISVANMGRKASEETKLKQSKMRKGKKRLVTWTVSEETKRKLSESLKGGIGWTYSIGIKRRKNTASKYVGVDDYRTGKWRSFVSKDGKQVHLGYFDSEEEAALAYNIKAIEYYGKETRLNKIENYSMEMDEKVRKILLMTDNNRKGIPTSKYCGVHMDKKYKRWTTRIKVNGILTHIGRFDTETEAALAYNEAAEFYYGFRAKLNIIPQFEIDLLWADCNTEDCI